MNGGFSLNSALYAILDCRQPGLMNWFLIWTMPQWQMKRPITVLNYFAHRFTKTQCNTVMTHTIHCDVWLLSTNVSFNRVNSEMYLQHYSQNPPQNTKTSQHQKGPEVVLVVMTTWRKVVKQNIIKIKTLLRSLTK